MKVVVIGATGTIGREVADALAERHTVVRASRSGATPVAVADPASIASLLQPAKADAVVCCAASPADRTLGQRLRAESAGEAAGSGDGGETDDSKPAVPPPPSEPEANEDDESTEHNPHQAEAQDD